MSRTVRYRAALTVALAAAFSAVPAAACSVCYGAANGSLITSARLGVFLLLGVTAAVLAAFARFFFHLRSRARQAEIDAVASDWAQVQRSVPQ